MVRVRTVIVRRDAQGRDREGSMVARPPRGDHERIVYRHSDRDALCGTCAERARAAIRNLTHTYGNGIKALVDVSLDIPRGMYGLLGPNGAGKSTLMRSIATLQKPTAGSITFEGIDILADPMRLRATLGYLPQDFGVYPRVSAEDLLDHIAVLKGIGPAQARREEVMALLQLTNLYEARKRAVASYSGGMRQRFGIAQALLGNPRLIIVDEPTAGLDPAERVRFHDLLAEIGEKAVVILSTHILEDVAGALQAHGDHRVGPRCCRRQPRPRWWRSSAVACGARLSSAPRLQSCVATTTSFRPATSTALRSHSFSATAALARISTRPAAISRTSTSRQLPVTLGPRPSAPFPK